MTIENANFFICLCTCFLSISSTLTWHGIVHCILCKSLLPWQPQILEISGTEELHCTSTWRDT